MEEKHFFSVVWKEWAGSSEMCPVILTHMSSSAKALGAQQNQPLSPSPGRAERSSPLLPSTQLSREALVSKQMLR